MSNVKIRPPGFYVDPDYPIALVGIPSHAYLWIIARQPTISDSDYEKITQIAKEQGFKIKKLRKTKQADCTPKNPEFNPIPIPPSIPISVEPKL